jgi:hypothetical protein
MLETPIISKLVTLNRHIVNNIQYAYAVSNISPKLCISGGDILLSDIILPGNIKITVTFYQNSILIMHTGKYTIHNTTSLSKAIAEFLSEMD